MNKQWRCKQDHILGLIMQNGADAPQLMIYRHAIDAGADHPAEVEVMLGPVTGMVPVQCDICGDVRVWQVSVSSLLYLVESMPTHLLFEFWRRLLERAKITPPPTLPPVSIRPLASPRATRPTGEERTEVDDASV